MGPRAGLDRCRKSRYHRESIPDRPARSQSLYQLSYMAHVMIYTVVVLIVRLLVMIRITPSYEFSLCTVYMISSEMLMFIQQNVQSKERMPNLSYTKLNICAYRCVLCY